MEGQKIDINKILQNTKKTRERKINDLESKSKQLFELVVIENFIVDDVISESYGTFFTPTSERRFGGPSPIYNGGFTSRLILSVSPKNKEVPILTLNFDGFSIVKSGDYISAKIPRYKKNKIDCGFNIFPESNYKEFYFDRGFNLEEFPIELSLLSENGNILRRDRSINYTDFIKK